MSPIEVLPGVQWVGVNDRTTDLFEGLWPIDREGISYNSYLISDERTAVVDLVKVSEGQAFLGELTRLADPADIDYVIVNHLEPDHSGMLTELLRLNPDVTIVGSARMKEMLAGFFGITENVRAVADGDVLDLGRTKLEFLMTPFVHWPETMMTYDPGRRILYCGDAFGSYGALKGALFEDEAADLAFYEREALRYFTNVIATFHRPVLKAVEKLDGLDIGVLAPAHGLCWRAEPRRIIDLYAEWARYAAEPGEPGVTLIYGTMYGCTEMMMNAVAAGIAEAGVPLDVFDVRRTHASYILPSLWTRRGLMVGAPTYEGSLFPPVREVLNIAATKAVKGKLVGLFGSHGWAGGAQREFEQLLGPLDSQLVEALDFCGRPGGDELAEGRAFGRRFAEKVASPAD